MALPPVSVKTAQNGDVNVNVNAGQSISATQGTAAASSGAWPVKLSDGIDDATIVADGDTATGQKGLVAIVAKASTSAPSPSNGTLTPLSVDTSGNLRVSLASASVTADTELPAAAALADNASNPTAPAVGAFGMLWDGATWDRAPGSATGGQFVQGDVAHDGVADANPLLMGGRAQAAAPTDVSADGDAVRAWFLRNGAQAAVLTAAGALIGGDATNGLDVDVTRVTGTVTVDSELPAAAALADGASNPTTPTVGAGTLAYNGATWDRVRGDTTNGLDVDVTRVSGTVTIAPAAPTNPVVEYLSATAIAVAGNTSMNSVEIGAVTKKLRKINVATTAQCRIELYRVIATVQDTNPSWVWITSNVMPSVEKTFAHQDFVSLTGTGGAGDNFRVKAFNLDAGSTADVYVTLEHAEN